MFSVFPTVFTMLFVPCKSFGAAVPLGGEWTYPVEIISDGLSVVVDIFSHVLSVVLFAQNAGEIADVVVRGVLVDVVYVVAFWYEAVMVFPHLLM